MKYNNRAMIKRFDEKFKMNRFGNLYNEKMYSKKELPDLIKDHIQSEIDIAVSRILSGIKPYTIKADDSVRMADLTYEQFESIVKESSFWADDEEELKVLESK